MTPTAEAALDWFRRHDGLGESPPGSNRNWVTDWWGLHDAWCAMAVSRALIEAGFGTVDRMEMPGVRTTQLKGWQYVPALARCWADAGRLHDDPQPGDLAIVVYPSSGGWRDATWQMPGDHVAMVESVAEDGSVVTWDGNVSGRIGRHRRPRSWFFGFARPPYAPAAAPPPGRPPLSVIFEEVPMPVPFRRRPTDYKGHPCYDCEWVPQNGTPLVDGVEHRVNLHVQQADPTPGRTARVTVYGQGFGQVKATVSGGSTLELQPTGYGAVAVVSEDDVELVVSWDRAIERTA